MPARSRGTQRFDALMTASRRDRDASRAVVSMLRADSKASQAIARALSSVELTLPQFNVLMVLAASAEGRMPAYELNAQLVSTPPNTSWLTARMEERRLIRRTRDTSDRRVVVLELTERGWTALGRAAPLVFEAEKELLEGFTRTELRQLGSLLQRFVGGAT